jgi:hypothetical protein
MCEPGGDQPESCDSRLIMLIDSAYETDGAFCVCCDCESRLQELTERLSADL